MLPEKLTADQPESERRRYKVVRRDDLTDVRPVGLSLSVELEIRSASVETGLCLLRWPGPDKAQEQEFNFGPFGLAIVSR